MYKKVETWTCDVDGCANEVHESHREKQFQVIMTTEQTEGRSVPSYFDMKKLDVCKECIEKMLSERKYLKGHGAQGFHKLYL